ncbi:MAG: hypothetical protein A4E28_00617 [Methanocella sp. PtaU1.Bin125]|nr:MAG: hypothetical protein A4E28_00617 [Methanocella sp. PtaU1.Bin125]
MRMLRVALVLFVLASFVGATVAVSMAATVTPTAKPTAKATMKPTGVKMPIKMTGKMIDLQQMKSTIGDVYKKLITGTKMPAKPAMPANNTTAKTGVNQTAGTVNQTAGAVNKTAGTVDKTATGANAKKWPAQTKPSMKLSTPSMRSIQTPSLSLTGAMPKTGNTTAKPGGTSGKKMIIGLGI